MSSVGYSAGEAFARSARKHHLESTRDIEIKGKIYTFIYETECGSYEDISGVDIDKIKILAESILSAHSTSNPDTADKQIDYIDKKGIHYTDRNMTFHAQAKLNDAYSGLAKVTKMTELTQQVSAFLKVVDKTLAGKDVDDSALDLLPRHLADNMRKRLFHSGYEKENVKKALKDAVFGQLKESRIIQDFFLQLNNGDGERAGSLQSSLDRLDLKCATTVSESFFKAVEVPNSELQPPWEDFAGVLGERIRFVDGLKLIALYPDQPVDKKLEDINNLMKDFSLAKHAWEKMIQSLTATDELYSEMSLSSNDSPYDRIGSSESAISITDSYEIGSGTEDNITLEIFSDDESISPDLEMELDEQYSDALEGFSSSEEDEEDFDDKAPLLRNKNSPRIEIDRNAPKPTPLPGDNNPLFYESSQVLHQHFDQHSGNDSEEFSLSSSDESEPEETSTLFQQLLLLRSQFFVTRYDKSKKKEIATKALEALRLGKMPEKGNQLQLIKEILNEKGNTFKGIVPGQNLGLLMIKLNTIIRRCV